jgi:cell wall-associated NlpC family hydrolase
VPVNGLQAGGAAVAGLVLVMVVAATAAGAGVASLLGGGAAAPGGAATAAIPAEMLRLYQRAAAACPGLPWTVLAAIGTVESGNGTSDLPGVHSGANWAGAEGPMQFLPATFAAYERPVPPGGARPPSPYDPVDAVYAAARDLCAHGAAGGSDLAGAVFAFNHDTRYVSQVLALARTYAQGGTGTPAAGRAGRIAVAWALAQVGTPYVWGGETPGVGFDCSGLVQAAYQAAGISLPRVAQDQYGAGPHLPPGALLHPGDLVFFGASTFSVTHVGIYVGIRGGQAMMADAPHTGADVRVEPFPATVGAPWGSDIYLGATRPSH